METKKIIAIIGSALAAMTTIACIVLKAFQTKAHGSGSFFPYLLVALVYFIGGMIITWLPRMVNKNWGFRMVDGRLKWTKSTNEVDVKRNRLVFLPLLTLFLELTHFFGFSGDMNPSNQNLLLQYLFLALMVVVTICWVVCIVLERKVN